MQIKELEDELGVSLVERRKSGIELTDQGKEIAGRARTILAVGARSSRLRQASGRVLSGSLKLGAIPSIAPYLLPEVLPELQSRFPKLNLQLRETLTANLVHEFLAGELDLILVAFPIEDPEIETLHSVRRQIHSRDQGDARQRQAEPRDARRCSPKSGCCCSRRGIACATRRYPSAGW